MFWYQLRNIDTKERLLIYNVMILILLFGANKRQTFTSDVRSLSVPCCFWNSNCTQIRKSSVSLFLYEVENRGKWKKPIRWINALSNKKWKKLHEERKEKDSFESKCKEKKPRYKFFYVSFSMELDLKFHFNNSYNL